VAHGGLRRGATCCTARNVWRGQFSASEKRCNLLTADDDLVRWWTSRRHELPPVFFRRAIYLLPSKADEFPLAAHWQPPPAPIAWAPGSASLDTLAPAIHASQELAATPAALAMFAAIRRASSRLSSFAAARRPVSSSK
jgi:hypothetical protein